jgi:DNA-binding response OmpR family regulator
MTEPMMTTTTHSTNQRRVLVADDDKVLLYYVTGILERAGYTPVVACDGREAFRIMRSDSNFLAAIFDADMPHLVGSDLVKYMRTEKRLMRIPVMIMSAGQCELAKSQEMSAGASIFLPKPFTAEQLHLMLKVLEHNNRPAPKRAAA